MEPNLARVGRYGALRLTFTRDAKRTILSRDYSTIPMKVFPPFYLDDTGCAYTYMINPTAGILGGDRIEIDITLNSQSHVFLSAPSATKILRGNGRFSTQYINITVKKDSTLEYLPGYIIPFRGSRHSHTLTLQMDRGATLILADIFCSGRSAMGERLMFDDYRSYIEINCEGNTVVADRMILRPKEADFRSIGMLEAHDVMATLFVIHEGIDSERTLIEKLWDVIDKSSDIIGGVSTLPEGGLVSRILGATTVSTLNTLLKLWMEIRHYLFSISDIHNISRFIT
ncbi:MAG: hypothetical protein GXO99_07315 [Nitrospirae bacterium]|nr:hypothetical protein [Nitrospirota bacterium]